MAKTWDTAMHFFASFARSSHAIFTVIFLLTIYCSSIQSQTFIKQNALLKSVSNSTTQNANSIIQDRNGFIWIASGEGLTKYDGHSFDNIPFPTTKTGLSQSHMTKHLTMDDEGFFWFIRNMSQLCRFDTIHQQFQCFNIQDKTPEHSDNYRVRSFTIGSNNTIWLASDQGLYRFNRTTFDTQLFSVLFKPIDKSTVSNRVLAVHEDKDNNLWYSTPERGLFKYDLSTKTLNNYLDENRHIHHLPAKTILTISDSNMGSIWLGGFGGLSKYHPETNKFESIELSHNGSRTGQKQPIVTTVTEDHNNRVWVGTVNSGLSMLEPATENDTQSLVQKYHSSNVPFVTSIAVDTSNVLWVTSAKEGVFKLKLGTLLFEHFATSKESSEIIYSIHSDTNDKLWIGTNKNLYSFDTANNLFDVVLENTAIVTIINSLNDESLLLSIAGKGVFEFNTVSNQLNPFTSKIEGDKTGFPGDHIYAIALEQNGSLWGGYLGANNLPLGLFSYSTTSGELNEHFNDVTVTDIEFTEKFVFVSTSSGGIYQSEKKQQAWRHLEGFSQPGGAIRKSIIDSNGNLWFASATNGLINYDISLNEYKFYTRDDGLQTNNVRCIAEDSSKNLWIVTGNGLSKLALDTRNVSSVEVNSRLSSQPLLASTCLMQSTDNMVIADINEFLSFQTHKVSLNNRNALEKTKLLFSKLTILNKLVGTKSVDASSPLSVSINEANNVTLDHHNTLFSIHFATNNHNISDLINYEYKLEGLNDKWVKTSGNERSATFISLPSGSYKFSLRGTLNSKPITAENRILKINILPPWWLSKVAYVIYFLLLVAILFMWHRYKMHGLIIRSKELETAVIQRTNTINVLLKKKERMFSSVSHELKTPLALIVGPTELLLEQSRSKDDKNKLKFIQRHTQYLSKLVEQILEFSKLDSGYVPDNQQYELFYTVNKICELFQPLCVEKELSLQVRKFDYVHVNLTKGSLEIIISNLISNAIKYTPKGGAINIDATNEKGSVYISVRDTGIGVDSAKREQIFNRFFRVQDNRVDKIQGSGVGLALVKELVEINGGAVYVQETGNKGSCFVVELPCKTVPQNETEDTTPDVNTIGINKTQISTISAQLEIESLRLSSDHSRSGGVSVQNVENHSVNNQNIALIIDDNDDMRTLISDCLVSEFNCLFAINGEEGIGKATENIPDVIICDVMMPGISGFDVVSRIKSNVLTSHIPTILLTAKEDLESKLLGWQEDIDDYLTKPFQPRELRARVKNLLSVRKLLQAHYERQYIKQDENPDISSADKTATLDDEFLQRFDSMIQENYTFDEFNRAKAAELMFVSKTQLYRKLDALLGMNFTDYLRRYRLREACQQLKSGKLISQVSFDVGFSSTSYFIKCFKSEYGMTPKRFQEN